MTINSKTLSTVEGLVTATNTTEGNFRTGLGDALVQVDTNQTAIASINAITAFPAFDNSTWLSANWVTTSGNSLTFTGDANGNGIFFIAKIGVRSANTSINGTFGASMSGNGSWCVFGGEYGGFLYTGGGTGIGGTIAGNMINHGVHGFIAAGGSLNLNEGSNAIFSPSGKYKEL